jgi:hypothetical protein
MMTPLTSAEKQARRQAALDDMARALGFISWSELGTRLKSAYQEGILIQVYIGKERRKAANSDKIKKQ